MENHRFVFVCGLQRSGTTMLYRYLSEHPEISKEIEAKVYEILGVNQDLVEPIENDIDPEVAAALVG